jgi:signal transduction histidine kinase
MEHQQELIPILFGILFVFVFLNLIICALLFLFYSKKIYRLLSLYWLGVLLVFIVQSQFQKEELPIMLAAGISFFPLAILARVTFDSFKERFPFFLHLFVFLLSYPVMIYLYKSGYGFTLSSLPGGLAISTPLIHAIYLLLLKKWSESTKLQRLLVVPYLAFIIHIFNFCFFRMDDNAQLWGWSVSFGIYQLLGILLPAFALEETHKTENARLFELVHDRTQELILSNGRLENLFKEKNSLFHVLIHDISNPLTVLVDQITKLKSTALNREGLVYAEKAEQLTSHLFLIINHLKQIEGRKTGKLYSELKPVGILESVNKIIDIFEFALEKKNLTVQIFNQTNEPDPLVMADETLLSSSVFSNIISNAIKFSLQRGHISILITDYNERFFKISFKDNGIGMNQEELLSIFHTNNPTSKPGTFLERGLGLGMPIVKMYIESFSGRIEVHSTERMDDNEEHGTEVNVYLNKANSLELSFPENYQFKDTESSLVN